MKIELSAAQIKNLKIFLERVSLSGKEVPAYVEIINALDDTENGPKEQDNKKEQ